MVNHKKDVCVGAGGRICVHKKGDGGSSSGRALLLAIIALVALSVWACKPTASSSSSDSSNTPNNGSGAGTGQGHPASYDVTIRAKWGLALTCKAGDDTFDSIYNNDSTCSAWVDPLGVSPSSTDESRIYVEITNRRKSGATESSWVGNQEWLAQDLQDYSITQYDTQAVSGEVAHLYKESYRLAPKDGKAQDIVKYYGVLETDDYLLVVQMPRGGGDAMLKSFLNTCKIAP